MNWAADFKQPGDNWWRIRILLIQQSYICVGFFQLANDYLLKYSCVTLFIACTAWCVRVYFTFWHDTKTILATYELFRCLLIRLLKAQGSLCVEMGAHVIMWENGLHKFDLFAYSNFDKINHCLPLWTRCKSWLTFHAISPNILRQYLCQDPVREKQSI
jgi:hypothetical protein